MAWVLVQLKLSIQRHSFAVTGAMQRVLYVGGWLAAALLGLGIGASMAFLSSGRNGAGDLGIVVLTSVILAIWAFGPIVAPGAADETVDPEKLEQFPLSPRQQVSGLLLGGLVGPAALMTFLGVAGGTFASEQAIVSRFAVVAAAALFTVVCVAVSRSVQAVLGRLLATSRGRDIVIAASGVVALALYLLTRGAHSLDDVLIDMEHSVAQGVLSWLPGGSIGQATTASRDGDWISMSAHLAVGLIALGIAWLAWESAIRRRVNGSSRRDSGHHQTHGDGSGLALPPFPLNAMVPTSTIGAASQHLRYFFFRSPRAIQTAVITPVLGFAVGHMAAVENGPVTGAIVFIALSVSSAAFNLLAFDDKGFSYLVASGAPLDKVLKGKSLSLLVYMLPSLIVVLIVESLISGRWGEFLDATLLGASFAVIGIAIGTVISVWLPVNQITRSGGKGRAFAGLFAGFGVMLVLGMIALAVLLGLPDVDHTVLGAAALVSLSAVSWLIMTLSGRRLNRHPLRVQNLLNP